MNPIDTPLSWWLVAYTGYPEVQREIVRIWLSQPQAPNPVIGCAS